MGTTVSRRLVFVKMKRKRALPKPKPPAPVCEDEILVGDEPRYSPLVFGTRRALPPAKDSPIWMVAGCWIGGLCLLVGAVGALISFAGKFQAPQEAAPVSSKSWNSPGYSRSVGSSNSGMSRGTGHANQAQSTTRGFLASPFNNRKSDRITCLAPVGGDKEAVSNLGKCLQQANNVRPDISGKSAP